MADPGPATAPATGRLARLGAWIDERFPMTSLWKEHVSEYYAPKNFNFWYYFGGIALSVFALQIVTGGTSFAPLSMATNVRCATGAPSLSNSLTSAAAFVSPVPDI